MDRGFIVLSVACMQTAGALTLSIEAEVVPIKDYDEGSAQ